MSMSCVDQQEGRRCLDPMWRGHFPSWRGSLTLATALCIVQDCSYFNSNAVPLKLAFQNVDPLGENIRVIFKVRMPVCLKSQHFKRLRQRDCSESSLDYVVTSRSGWARYWDTVSKSKRKQTLTWKTQTNQNKNQNKNNPKWSGQGKRLLCTSSQFHFIRVYHVHVSGQRFVSDA